MQSMRNPFERLIMYKIIVSFYFANSLLMRLKRLTTASLFST